jgi:hypothetical protein
MLAYVSIPAVDQDIPELIVKSCAERSLERK